MQQKKFCSVTISNDCDRVMEIFCHGNRNNPWELLGPIYPGETQEHYKEWLSNLYVFDKKSGERQQEFEIFSEGMHLSILPQPKIVARQNLLQNYTEYFSNKYKEKNGKEWRNCVARNKVSKFIWNSPEEGTSLTVHSSATKVKGPELAHSIEPALPLKIDSFELKTMSLSPKLFQISEFVSVYEADFLLRVCEKSLMDVNELKNYELMEAETNANGSKTAWVSCRENPILTNICHRAFDLLKLPRKSTMSQSCESVQFTVFDEKSESKAVKEYLVPGGKCELESVKRGNNRFVTVLVCLKTPSNGLEIFFPKSKRGSGEKEELTLSLPLEKGNALILYNMERDGNLDEDAVYRVAPLEVGEEFVLMAIRVWDKTIF